MGAPAHLMSLFHELLNELGHQERDTEPCDLRESASLRSAQGEALMPTNYVPAFPEREAGLFVRGTT